LRSLRPSSLVKKEVRTKSPLKVAVDKDGGKAVKVVAVVEGKAVVEVNARKVPLVNVVLDQNALLVLTAQKAPLAPTFDLNVNVVNALIVRTSTMATENVLTNGAAARVVARKSPSLAVVVTTGETKTKSLNWSWKLKSKKEI
jgi:hypothetical protein